MGRALSVLRPKKDLQPERQNKHPLFTYQLNYFIPSFEGVRHRGVLLRSPLEERP